jgi:UDPglucose 6-dehydrogenase
MYVIAGFGYVGSALYNTASKRLPHYIIDPQFPERGSWDLLHSTTQTDTVLGGLVVSSKRFVEVDGIIVCVSTPQAPDGSCNIDNVLDVLKRVAHQYPDVPVLIKSTLTFGSWDTIKAQRPHMKITYSPEFLKAADAAADFAAQDFVVLGDDTPDATWTKYFNTVLPKAHIHQCAVKEAIMMKYASNGFLAVKVSFFNHIFDLCQRQGLDFDVVRSLLIMRDDIGANHTTVTQQRGWGGFCFPKDTAALLHACDLMRYDFATLKAAVDYNWSIRRGILDTKDIVEAVVPKPKHATL